MVIGITGGIGSGKSTVLNLLNTKYGFYIFEADKIAHELMQKGNTIYNKVVENFGKGILNDEQQIDRKKMGKLVFEDKDKLKLLNEIVHPEVINEIHNRIEYLKKNDNKDQFVIEAALLIESGCDQLCDTVWYVFADETVRIDRLKMSRNMTDEQIRTVMKNQLDKEMFSKGSKHIINNSLSIENTDLQIQKLLEIC